MCEVHEAEEHYGHRGAQTRRKVERLAREGFVPPGPSNPAMLALPLLAEQHRHQLALTDGGPTTEGARHFVVTLLGDAQFEVELAELEMREETAWLERCSSFEVVERGIDPALHGVSHPQGDVAVGEVGRDFEDALEMFGGLTR